MRRCQFSLAVALKHKDGHANITKANMGLVYP